MNERIKELAEQAQDNGDAIHYYDPIFAKKFAELIVRECADIALKKGMASPDTDFRTGSYVINQYLLTHFGVEK
jgi:hypothetical protein